MVVVELVFLLVEATAAFCVVELELDMVGELLVAVGVSEFWRSGCVDLVVIPSCFCRSLKSANLNESEPCAVLLELNQHRYTQNLSLPGKKQLLQFYFELHLCLQDWFGWWVK